ncbi:MAG: S-layer homology domain-containing protein [Clostridiaceae bacterium]|nr:S-layer homology domain-containing protein [Clostridiaceae bacterium]
MKQAPKRALSVVLAFCLVLTMFTGLISTQAASPFPDLSTSHWAYDVIVGMYNMGYVKGDNKGKVNPESYVTTAEFMALINRMFGLYLTANTGYSDTTGHWGNNENVFSYAAAQGYIIVESGNKIQPDAYLSREKAFALIARYLGLDESNYAYFTDNTSISNAYRGLVNAAAAIGIVDGYTDGSVKPQQYLRRSEAMKILYYMVGGNIISGSASNLYNTNISKSSICAAITGRNVSLTNSTLRGTVYISEGATNGTVTISNSSISTLVVRASNVTINLQNSTVTEIDTDSSASGSVAIYATGTSSVGTVTAYTGTSVTDSTTNGSSFSKVVSGTSAQLTLAGTFPSVVMLMNNGRLVLSGVNTLVKSLAINNTASNTAISGEGTVSYITVAAAGVTTTMLPGQYIINTGLSAKFAGATYTGSGTTTGVNSGFVAPYPYANVSSATGSGISATKNITVNIKAVANGTVYALAYPAADAEPTYSQIISYANTSSGTGAWIGKSASVTANTATTITLPVNVYYNTGDYEVAVLFVPTTGTQTTYNPVYGPVKDSYTTYMGFKGDYYTGFIANPQITAYTASTASAAGSVTVSFQTVIPGTVYLYAYTGTTVPTYSTIRSYGTAVTMAAGNGYYGGSGTLTLTKNTSYTGVAAYFVPTNATFTMTPVYSQTLVYGNYLYALNTSVNTDTGFYTGYPYISYYSGGSLKLTAKPQYSGTMYYAVVAADYYPTAAEIYGMTSSNNTKCYSKGYLAVTAGQQSTTTYLSVPSINAANYKVVAVLKTTNGGYYAPVANSIVMNYVLYPYNYTVSNGFGSGYPSITDIYLSSGKYYADVTVSTIARGTVYLAVVKKDYNPTAKAIVNANKYADPKSNAYIVYSSDDVVLTSANYTMNTTLQIPSDYYNSYKLVAVFVPYNSTMVYSPVAALLSENATVYSYIADAPSAVFSFETASSANDVPAGNKLYLTYDETMAIYSDVNDDVNTYNLYNYSSASLKDYFKVMINNGTVQSPNWVTVDNTTYDIAVSSNSKTVTFTLKADKFWPAGTLRVWVDRHVVNADLNNHDEDYADNCEEFTFIVKQTAATPTIAVTKTATNGYWYNANLAQYTSTLYYEADSASIGSFTLTNNNPTATPGTLYYQRYNASSTAIDTAAVAYTGAVTLTSDVAFVKYWSELNSVKSVIGTLTVISVAKPVVAFANVNSSMWTKDSTVKATVTLPTGAALNLNATVGANAAITSVVTSGAGYALNAGGTAIVAEANMPTSLTIPSGTALKFNAEVKINGNVVAKSADATATVGAIQSSATAPKIMPENLAGSSWYAGSKVTISAPDTAPLGSTLYYYTNIESTPVEITSPYTKTFSIEDDGTLVSPAVTTAQYTSSTPTVVITAETRASDGTTVIATTTYTVSSFVNIPTDVTVGGMWGAMGAGNTAVLGTYSTVGAINAGNFVAIPSGCKITVTSNFDAVGLSFTSFDASNYTKVYFDQTGKLTTTAPAKTIQSGDTVTLTFKLIHIATGKVVSQSTNTITTLAVYPTPVITAANLGTDSKWVKGSSFKVTVSDPLPTGAKLYVNVFINGVNKVAGAEIVAGTSYFINAGAGFTLSSTAGTTDFTSADVNVRIETYVKDSGGTIQTSPYVFSTWDV